MKVGRPKKIQDPKKLWEWFKEYEMYCKNNPRHENILHQRSGEVIPVKRERPLSRKGFSIWLKENNKTTTLLKFLYNEAQTDYYKSCDEVIELIETYIDNDQFEGAAVGVYKEGIMGKKLFAERQEVTVTQEQPLFPDVE